MTSDRWRRVTDLYEAVLEKAPADREAFLREFCGDDSKLRDEVTSLLAQDRHDSPLDHPVWVSDELASEHPVFAAGTILGAYCIVGLIGEAGMGQVYRATDTNLGRQVAVKVLPAAFVQDRERLARFEREAKTLAALNHPHIAQIYGLERSATTPALVMELVEGETLADRIARGPIAVDDALPIAKQIAEALEAAHEQGIIHRDLKPANIKVREDGTVKVLDFGLAKLVEPNVTNTLRAPNALSMSPTITSPALMTGVGVLLGTAAYMSPEQAKGKPADKRSDVWAFGCVLYEMLTGRRAFDGEDVTDTLAAVVRAEPNWHALPQDSPLPIRRLLRRCLEKNRRRRLDSSADARLEIEDAQAPGGEANVGSSANATVRQPVWRRVLVPIATLIIGGAVAGASVWLAMRSEPPRVTVFTATPTGTAELTANLGSRAIAITPDGSRIVYVGNNGTQLYVRDLSRLESIPLTERGAPRDPFVAPDGQWVGFMDAGALKKVAIGGGPPVTLARLGSTPTRGATWGADGTIIYAQASLFRISSAGGAPTVLLKPDPQRDEPFFGLPELLPGGQALLFTTVQAARGGGQVEVLDMRTGARKVLLSGVGARYVPSGHLLYAAASTLLTVGFNVNSLEVVGDPRPVQPAVTMAGFAVNFAVARDGTLAYVRGTAEAAPMRTLVWVDRQGRGEALGTPARSYFYPRLSPNGQTVAVAAADQDRDIWQWDLSRRTMTRLTFDAGDDRYPVWTPDGRRLAWASTRSGPFNILWQAADATGAVERLTQSSHTQAVNSFSPDGTRLVLRDDGLTTSQDLAVLTVSDRRVMPLLQTPFNERNGEISPNGRWIAYESDETGRFEVYVRPFPNIEGGKWPVSTGGGQQALWSRTGQELFYRAPDGAVVGVMVNASADGTHFRAGVPKVLVSGSYYAGSGVGVFGRTYDVSADGKRFLMIKDDGPGETPAAAQVVVVEHWVEGLKRLGSPK